MITKFRAFAKMQNGAGETWRVNIYNYDTEEEAKEAARKFAEKYNFPDLKAIYVGVHRYYILSRADWEKEKDMGYTGVDGKTKTWMFNEGNGCALLFEGVHFDIR